jgi:hypothetical protein
MNRNIICFRARKDLHRKNQDDHDDGYRIHGFTPVLQGLPVTHDHAIGDRTKRVRQKIYISGKFLDAACCSPPLMLGYGYGLVSRTDQILPVGYRHSHAVEFYFI